MITYIPNLFNDVTATEGWKGSNGFLGFGILGKLDVLGSRMYVEVGIGRCLLDFEFFREVKGVEGCQV